MKMQKRTALLLAVLVPTMVALTTFGCWLAFRSQPKQPTLFLPDSQFAIGINYPWRNYGGDFGAQVWGTYDGVNSPNGTKEVDADFDHLSKLGLSVVRWFVYCDGRGGLTFDKNGQVTGLDQYVLDDMSAAVRIAHAHSIRIIFVLLDFSFVQKTKFPNVGGHRKIIEKPEYTVGFLNNAVAPLLKKFGDSPDIAAWEIINEPEWVMTAHPYWQKSKIGNQRMQTFVYTTAQFIKARAKQPVTLGSATQSDLDYWDNVGLDFLEFHSYPSQERQNPLDTPVDDLGHDIPIILGEFPTDNTTHSTDQYFELMYKNGYVGALAWSFRATDKYTNLAKQEPAIIAWQKAQAAKAKQKHP